ncbi:hypothetical protein [Streptomyces sp. NPDC059168]|uniref:hypothetical protein n=1 Tax=Streptomyces sp. NPDC059168 TaxID=3346753 RepID=UPI0036C05210
MNVPRLSASLGGLSTAALGALASAPWWAAAPLAFASLLVLRAEALVHARNEARRGVQEHRLLARTPRRQALAYLQETRRGPRTPATTQPQPRPQPEPEPGAGAGGGTA